MSVTLKSVIMVENALTLLDPSTVCVSNTSLAQDARLMSASLNQAVLMVVFVSVMEHVSVQRHILGSIVNLTSVKT